MRRLTVLLALAASTACGGTGTGTNPSASDVAGTYSLKTYNGATLPVVVAVSGADTATLLDDRYTLTADARFTELFRVQRRQAGVLTTREVGDTGSFTRNGTSIQLIGLGSVITPGEIKGGTLQLSTTNPDIVRVYTR